MLFIEEMSEEKYAKTFPEKLESVRIDSASQQGIYAEAMRRATMLAPGEYRVIDPVRPVGYIETQRLSTTIKNDQRDLPRHEVISRILDANGYTPEHVKVIGKTLTRTGIGVAQPRFDVRDIVFVCRYRHMNNEHYLEESFENFKHAKEYALELLQADIRTGTHNFSDVSIQTRCTINDPTEGPIERMHIPSVFIPNMQYAKYEASVDVKVPKTDSTPTKLVIGNTVPSTQATENTLS